MTLKLYQVDAFAKQVFQGNPAAVVPLEAWLPDATLQAIARENNLAETVYFIRDGANWQIRWFTPEIEMDLCGHATLASAWLMFQHLGVMGQEITFGSKSGPLIVRKVADGRLELDFPSRPPERVAVHERLIDGLGTQPLEVLASRDYLVVYRDAEEVLGLQPDMTVLAKLDRMVIATGPGRSGDCDFVSRFFAPQAGVPEDPVTGSAHCTLIPYWAKRLGKTEMFARQVSARGGELWVADRGERVGIAGECALYLVGEILV